MRAWRALNTLSGVLCIYIAFQWWFIHSIPVRRFPAGVLALIVAAWFFEEAGKETAKIRRRRERGRMAAMMEAQRAEQARYRQGL